MSAAAASSASLRAYRDDEVGAVFDFLARTSDQPPPTVTELAQELGSPVIDREEGVWVVEDGGAIAGFARLRIDPADDAVVGFIRCDLAPALAAAIEPGLVERLCQRTGALAAARGLPPRVLISVAGDDRARGERLAALGFRADRVFLVMQHRRDAALLEAPLPDGYRLRPSRGAADAEAHVAAINDAWRDHYNYTPITVADLLHDQAGPEYDPELDLLVVDPADRIAGFAYSALHGERGDVHELGVCRDHRRLGVGAAALRESLLRLYAAGATQVQLRVDAESATGAGRLYDRAGFFEVSRRVTYVR